MVFLLSVWPRTGETQTAGAGTPECPHTFLSLCLWSHHLSSPLMAVGCLGWLWSAWLPGYISPGRSSIAYCDWTAEATQCHSCHLLPAMLDTRVFPVWRGGYTDPSLNGGESLPCRKKTLESGIILVWLPLKHKICHGHVWAIWSFQISEERFTITSVSSYRKKKKGRRSSLFINKCKDSQQNNVHIK